jgi:hypothetical protein
MSSLSYFPSDRKRWIKKMVETVKALPARTYAENVETISKTTGKKEVRSIQVPLTKRRITKLVTKKYNLSEYKSKKANTFSEEDIEKAEFQKIKKEKKLEK